MDRIYSKIGRIEKAGLGFLLAFGIQAWVLQIAYVVGLPPGAPTHLAISILGAALGLGLHIQQVSRSPEHRLRSVLNFRRIPFKLLPRIGFFTTIFAILAAGTMCSPVLQWDPLAIWVGKAMGLIVSDSLTGILVGAHPEYPIGLPILMAAALDLAGEPGVKLIGPLFAAALTAVVLGTMDRQGPRWVGGLTVLCIIVTPFVLSFTFVAFAELPMTAAYVASSIYLIEFIQTRNRRALWISGLLLGVTLLIRPEAPLLCAVNSTVLALCSRPYSRRNLGIYLGVLGLAWLPWQIISRLVLDIHHYNASLLLTPVQDIIRSEFDWPRIGRITEYFLTRSVLWEWWGLTFPLTALGLIVFWLLDKRVGATLTLLLVGNLAVQHYTYYSSIHLEMALLFEDKLHYFLESGFDRMTLHWIPIGIYGVGLAMSKLHQQSIQPKTETRN